MRLVLRLTLLLLYIALLWSLSDQLSLSEFELDIYYNQPNSLLYIILHALTELFGTHEVVLRFFMISVHLTTLFLYYKVSKHYIERFKDMRWNILIFLLLPAVVGSAIIINNAGLVLLFLLLFIYLFNRFGPQAMLVLPFYVYIDESFIVLFLALTLYFAIQKQYVYSIVAILFLVLSYNAYEVIAPHYPQNYLQETLTVLTLIFSPLLFFYFIFTLFAISVRQHKDFVWLLSTVALISMLVLSLRQKPFIEDFAPYVIVFLPQMVKEFMHGYRLRIRKLRFALRVLFTLSIFFLIMNSLLFYANKALFYFVDKPEQHFMYKHYIVKELVDILDDRGIESVVTEDKKLMLRLRFYNKADKNADFRLTEDSCKNVTIRYFNKSEKNFCVTKVIKNQI